MILYQAALNIPIIEACADISYVFICSNLECFASCAAQLMNIFVVLLLKLDWFIFYIAAICYIKL